LGLALFQEKINMGMPTSEVAQFKSYAAGLLMRRNRFFLNVKKLALNKSCLTAFHPNSPCSVLSNIEQNPRENNTYT